MPFTIVRNDITSMAVDAIVNSTGPLFQLGGADAAIHRAAGPELLEHCRSLGNVEPGKPLITPGFRLPCRYVIHTIAPVWRGGGRGEGEQLSACYRSAMELAAEKQLESIAFPLMSSGLFGFPREKALVIAMDAIRDFVLHHDLMVYLVVYDAASFRISEKLQQNIRQYIDDRYVDEHGGAPQAPVQMASAPLRDAAPCRERGLWNAEEEMSAAMPLELPEAEACPMAGPEPWDEDFIAPVCPVPPPPPVLHAAPAPSIPDGGWETELSRLLKQQDESFTQRLLRLIDESGMSDPECYRRANVDRRVFSKIRSNAHYQPSKQTAVAFAVALRLSLSHTEELLRTAGLALSRSNHFDLIVSYFIEQGIYDVMIINEALYAFDQPLLGVKN